MERRSYARIIWVLVTLIVNDGSANPLGRYKTALASTGSFADLYF